VVQVLEPGVDVTVYPVIDAPPSLEGLDHATVDWVDSLELAITPVGAVGTDDGVAVFEISDAALIPARFVAVTANV
jgi:hypothetical protein